MVRPFARNEKATLRPGRVDMVSTIKCALILLLVSGGLAGCAGAPMAPEASAPVHATEAPAEPVEVEPPVPALPDNEQSAPKPAIEFALQYTPVPIETAGPPMELPSLEADASQALDWVGQPTYLAESQPEYFFRVQYDPALWARTTDELDSSELRHRVIPYCVLSSSSARGLPLNAVVAHESRRLGSITYEVDTVFTGGQRQLVNYVGGDGLIFTGFEVTFQGEADACLLAAEVVLGSLRSLPASLATAVP